MGYISRFKSGFNSRDRLDPTMAEARQKRLALEERIAKVGREAMNHSDILGPNVIDASFDGLEGRRPDEEIPHMTPEEAIPAINADVPRDPHLN